MLDKLTATTSSPALYGTCTDINGMKEAQAELLALPEKLPSLPMCVWKITPRGDVVYANKVFKDYVGAKDGASLDSLNVFSDKVFT